MRCDDFICLGRTVPEESKKYGAKVCMAGVSPEVGSLMRVYPLPVQNPIQIRHQCVLELERNRLDSRRESWKLSDRSAKIIVSHKPVMTKETIASYLGDYIVESIDELNNRRMSLGVIELIQPQGFFRERKGVVSANQGMLFEITDKIFGAGSIDIAPYIGFWDQTGKHHDLQIREWGCYEWIRKHRNEAYLLWKNLKLDRNEPLWAIVGNQANRLTSWLIISTFTIPSETQQELF